MDVDAEELTQAAASQPSEMVNGHAEDDFHKTDKSKSKLSLKYSEYKSMATQLVITIRRSEERAEGGEWRPLTSWKFYKNWERIMLQRMLGYRKKY